MHFSSLLTSTAALSASTFSATVDPHAGRFFVSDELMASASTHSSDRQTNGAP